MRRFFRSLCLIAVLALPFAAIAVAQEAAPVQSTTEPTHAEAAEAAHATIDAVAGHGEAAGDEHGEEKPELLKANPGLFIWQIILFVAFFAAASLFVWPKILGGLKGREAKLLGDLQAAETGAKEAAAKLAQLNQQLADAQKQAQKVVDEARVAAGKVAADVKAGAEREINDLKNRAAAEIKSAKEQAVAEIGAQVADLATAVAGKILAREVSGADQQALVASALSELAAKN